MKLFLSRPRGFCAGVVRAIQTVEQSLKMFGAPIYVKHQIVHNRYVVEDLKKKGVIFIEDLKEVPEGAKLVYSAHGVSPKVKKEAKKRKLVEIDATCGLVTKLHSAAKRYASLGYHILLIGHKNHVEVRGAFEEAPTVTTIIESLNDIETLPRSFEKVVYLTQTTLSLEDIDQIAEALLKRFPNIEKLPSSCVCYATTNRQMALKKLIPLVDIVFVVGDPMSSNSNRLKEIALKQHVKAYLIQDEKEIVSSQLQGVKTIGMTAGASTPEEIVQKCISQLKSFGVKEVEEVIFTEEHVVFQIPKILRPVAK